MPEYVNAAMKNEQAPGHIVSRSAAHAFGKTPLRAYVENRGVVVLDM